LSVPSDKSVASSATAYPPTVLGVKRNDRNDFRHPENEFHAAGQKLRGRIGMVLRHRDYIREFKREDIPTPQRSPTTHRRLTSLLQNRDRVEHKLYLLHSDIDANGARVDPKRDIEPEYQRLCGKLNDLNRNMFQVYTDHLAPFEIGKNASDDQTLARETPQIVPSRGQGVSLGSEAIRQAMDHQSDTSPPAAARGKREYHTECWPSTGDRRGNPKDTYDRHGHLRQPPEPKRAKTNTTPIAADIVNDDSNCPAKTHIPSTKETDRRQSSRPTNNK
jgi:hypothetical protein